MKTVWLRKEPLTTFVKTTPSCFYISQALDSLRIEKDSCSSSESNMTADLKRFTQQCSLGFAQRHLAAQKEAYPTILSCCRKSVEEQEALLASLSALAALTDGQPDLLDPEGRDILLSILGKYQADPAVTRVGIRTVRHCCLKHEKNRQDLVKAGVLPLLTGAITRHTGCAELVKEASATLRFMTFDDDIRVPFGQAHEHAKMIVLEHSGLKVIIEAARGETRKRGKLIHLGFIVIMDASIYQQTNGFGRFWAFKSTFIISMIVFSRLIVGRL